MDSFNLLPKPIKYTILSYLHPYQILSICISNINYKFKCFQFKQLFSCLKHNILIPAFTNRYKIQVTKWLISFKSI